MSHPKPKRRSTDLIDAVMGIDPGQAGGICVLGQLGSAATAISFYKIDGFDKIYQALVDIRSCYRIAKCLIEKPQVVSRQAFRDNTKFRGMGTTSAFSFGEHYGQLIACLRCLGFDPEEIRPQDWMTAMNCRTKGDKHVSLAKAKQLYQSLEKITLWQADALLIATYAKVAGRKRKL